ncbi:hypothetical protein [Natronococcus jeotgali]|uniref:Uncharacterized protein n=1 Tax=Natronococcus jeotgali DSM 18795 TaxID=1227498 RepID=L9XIL4_9EURY|nr:hypothetical protein [Natronococcus jeotgali]ELY61266.1 hypothetical protein C492_09530 [Natronococcus jeotgali DSM 18795]
MSKVEAENRELRQENQDQAERIDELEEELEELTRWRGGISNWTESNTDRIADLEDEVEEIKGTGDETPTPQGGESTTPEPQTPIEDVVDLPEGLVEDNLTANQERARFVAKDISDYSKSVPAGRAIKSSDLRKVLRAKEDSRVHTQTVSRVIERLDELGKSEVEVRESRSGERAVVFSEEIVSRIESLQRSSNDVVIGEEVCG